MSVLYDKRYYWYDVKFSVNGFYKDYSVGEGIYVIVYQGY